MADITPTKAGYYWAQWRIANEGTRDGDELTPDFDWRPVQIFENCLDDTDPEHLMVEVGGVEKAQSLDCFVWGREIPAMSSTAAIGELERKATAFDACQWYWPEDDTSSEACADNPFEILQNNEAINGDVIAVSRGGVVETRFYARLAPVEDSDSDDTFDVDEPTYEAAEAKIAAERARRNEFVSELVGGDHG